MAKIDIGTVTANLDTRQQEAVPALELRAESSYLFFIRTATPNLVNSDAYLNIVAIINTGTLVVKTPLLVKYFFTGEEMCFLLSVPRIDGERDPLCAIAILPREFYRNRATIRSIDCIVSYDDARDYEFGASFAN